MSRIIRTVLFVLAVSGMVISGLIAADGLEILHPMDKKIYHVGHAGVTVKLNDRNISRVMIITDTNERYPLELTRECGNICSKILTLHPGENRIRIEGYTGDKLVYAAKSELYYGSQVIKGLKNPPKKYSESFFHTAENEKSCSECHDMNSNETKGVAFVNVEDSNCYTCHKKMTVEKYAHAPAVNWLCTSCHTGKTGDKNKGFLGQSKYLVPEPVAPVCFVCHDKTKQLWDAKKYKHLPVETGRCITCHDPHASENPMFLREMPNRLCAECHKDKTLSSQMRGNSKCPGTQDESCVKCHNPHASNHPFFIDPPRTHTVDSPEKNNKGRM